MTFKHTKFEDSTTMRSLVKVAQDKGWIKEEPLQKTASAPKLDLNPTENLTENLVKLCTGLRAKGFDKQADELESKFVQYKKANAEYGVGNEEGEDLIHAAHPKGSHKMENIDSSEATFEDILDKHVKMMQVVEKKPTGKLSNANEILGAVSKVLGASFLGQKKVAQEANPPAESGGSTAGGIAEGLGLSAGIWGTTAGLKWLYKTIISKTPFDKAVIEAEKTFGKLPKSDIANLRSALAKDEIKESLKSQISKELGKDATQAIEKEVAKDIAQGARSAATSATESAAESAGEKAATSPGVWSKVINFLKSPVGGGGAAGEGAAAEGAAGAAGEAGAAGAAGEAGAAAGVGAGGAAGAAAAAGIVAALATWYVTSKIYESKFNVDNLKEAGDKLTEELKDVQDVSGWSGQRAKEVQFQQSLAACFRAAQTAQAFVSSPTVDSLNALKQYEDALQSASNAANSLRAAANAIRTDTQNMKPGESREDPGWLSEMVSTSPMARFFGADSPQLADVEIAAGNFVNQAQKSLVDVRMAINKAIELVGQAIAKKQQAVGGPGVVGLATNYASLLQNIKTLKARLAVSKAQGAQQLSNWLDKVTPAVTARQAAFQKDPNHSDPVVLKSYQDKYDEVKKLIDSFSSKYDKIINPSGVGA